MHLPQDEQSAQVRRKPYEAPVMIDYGDVVTITQAGVGGQTVDGFGDPPDSDDPAYVSGGG